MPIFLCSPHKSTVLLHTFRLVQLIQLYYNRFFSVVNTFFEKSKKNNDTA